MQKLCIIAQKVDEHDDLLGFFVGWIREFEKHFDVEVVALHDKTPRPKLIRWIVFVYRVFRGGVGSDAIFCHMSPIFAVIAGLTSKPTYLWYLHREVSWRLLLAEKFCTKIFTASAESLNLKSKKIVALGHGIDTSRFAANSKHEIRNSKKIKILSVGRISPIKHYEVLLRTGLPATIVGRPIMPGDFSYFEGLKKFANARFVGFVPYTDMPRYYAEADVIVNMAPRGGLDKAVLEGMAAGCIPLTSNDAFRPIFGAYAELFIVPFDDAKALAERIERLCQLSPDEQERLRTFVTGAVQPFDLSLTIAKISRILAG